MSTVQSTSLFRERESPRIVALLLYLSLFPSQKIYARDETSFWERKQHIDIVRVCRLKLTRFTCTYTYIYTYTDIRTWKLRFLFIDSDKRSVVLPVQLYCNEQSEGTLKYQVAYSVSSTYDYLASLLLLRVNSPKGFGLNRKRILHPDSSFKKYRRLISASPSLWEGDIVYGSIFFFSIWPFLSHGRTVRCFP